MGLWFLALYPSQSGPLRKRKKKLPTRDLDTVRLSQLERPFVFLEGQTASSLPFDFYTGIKRSKHANSHDLFNQTETRTIKWSLAAGRIVKKKEKDRGKKRQKLCTRVQADLPSHLSLPSRSHGLHAKKKK